MLHCMSIRTKVEPCSMQRNPAYFKLSSMDLSHSNRLTALSEPCINGSLSYYSNTYRKENRKEVTLIVTNKRKKEYVGVICLFQADLDLASVFYINTGDVILPVYDIEGDVIAYFENTKPADRYIIHADSVETETKTVVDGHECFNVVFKYMDNDTVKQFTVKQLPITF